MSWQKFRKKLEHIKAFQITQAHYDECVRTGEAIYVEEVRLFVAHNSINPIYSVFHVSVGQWLVSAKVSDWIVHFGDRYGRLTDKEFKETFEVVK